jgi:hypothetical protein
MCGEIFLWAIGGFVASMYVYGIVWFLIMVVPRWFWLFLLAPPAWHLLTILIHGS